MFKSVLVHWFTCSLTHEHTQPFIVKDKVNVDSFCIPAIDLSWILDPVDQISISVCVSRFLHNHIYNLIPNSISDALAQLS